MKTQIITFNCWDNSNFSIDFSQEYQHYCHLYQVDNFNQLSDSQSIAILKNFINDFRLGKISLDILCTLCYELYFNSNFSKPKSKLSPYENLLLSLTELSFDIRNNPLYAGETLTKAFKDLS